MINIPNSTKQNSNQSADRFKAHWLLTLGLLWLFVSNVAAQCPDLGPRKTVASSFHSSLIIDSADIVRYWGDAINQDGSAADVLSPLTLTGYTGSPLAVAASSISATDHQHYLLTTTNLYGWGHSARTINTAVITDVALTTIALPAGVLIGDINFIRASNGGVALVTNSGHVWIKAGNNSVCNASVYGDGSASLDVNWHQVTTSAVGNPVLTGVTMFSFTGTSAMALTASGDVYVWGSRTYLGDGSAVVATRNRATLIPLSSILPGITPADVNIVSYYSGTTDNASQFILTTNGKLYAVGYNNAGQLGQGNTTNLLTWTIVKDAAGTGELSNIIQLTSNNPFSFNRYTIGVLTAEKTVYLWGYNDQSMGGQNSGNILLPRIPDNYNVSGAKVSYLEMGGHTTLTFLEGTNKFCYIGHKIRGSMGDGTILSAAVPSFDCYNTPQEYLCPAPQKFCVTPSSNDLVATANHATVLVSDFPSFKYWGESSSSYLTPGLNELDPQDLFEYNGVPKGVAAGSVGNTLEASTTQMWALTTAGLWGWGYSANTVNNGVAGNVVNTSVALPTGVDSSDIAFIRAARGGVALVTVTGEVWIKAGAGSSCVASVYGDGTGTLNSNWHQVTTSAPGNPALTGVTELSFGGTVAMAVTLSGAYVWGQNTFLGDGSAATTRNRATLVGTISGVTPVSVEIVQAGSNNAAQFILGNNGKVYAVGENKDGVLGQNNTSDLTTWTTVKNAANTGDLVSVSKLSSNNPYAYDSYSVGALTINGTLYLWGDNTNSRLGGVAARYLLPQIPPSILPGTISNFDIGGHFTIMFRKGSSIFCFVGHQVNGSLGDNTTNTSNISTPECVTTPVIPQCAGVAYTISGNVYNDTTGTTDNLVDGTPMSSINGTQLHANLLDANGFVLATMPIAGGAYSFPDYPAGSYTVQVSANAGTIGDPAPVVGLPSPWLPTGEQIGTTPNVNLDAPINGFLPITVSGSSVTNANFGLSHPKPKAINDTTSTAEDTPISFSLSNNDFSVLNNIDPTTVTLISTPPSAQGTVVNNGDGTITFTPALNFNGTVTPFEYRICTTDGLCDTATVYITVTPVDDLPEAIADNANTNEDTPLSSTVASNDVMSGDGGNTFNNSCPICTTTSNGTLTFNADGTYNYTPNTNYNGNDQFIYQLCDTDGDCDTAIVNITVNSVDDLPEAIADNANTNEDTPLSSTVASNDVMSGDGGNTFNNSCPICTTTSNGTLTFNADGTYNYTPNANYNGNDQFIYQLCDTDGDCDTAIVNITVNSVDDLPEAIADNANTNEDTPLSSTVASNDVMSGDGGNTFNNSCPICTTTSNGTLTFNADGTYNYTPNTNYNGNDQFIYQLCDTDGDCDTAIVNITVTPVNDLPTAEADEASVPEDGNTTIPVLTNDTFGGDGPSTGTITITQGPSNGTASVDNNGTPTDPTDDQITYTPNADYNGADNIIYEICDSNGDCDTAIVNITVTPVNDLPTAEADEASVPEDGNTTIPVLTNDTFGGDGPSTGTITITQGPSNGTASVDDNGTPTDPTDDQITYTPNADYNGADNIIYEICDSNGDCDTAIVNITVTPVNDLPTAEADEASVPEDGNTTIPVLTNDTFGGDGPSTGTITITQGPSNGTASVDDNGTPTDPTDDQITYTPNADYNGADNIIYEICDSNGDCDTAIVNITVTPVNDLPTAEADEASVPEDGNTTIPVLTNDTFGGDGPSTGTITITQGPSNGTASVDDNGTPTDPTDDQITYTPNADYNGADNIIYEICDSNGDCDTAIVNITVTPVNDLPTAEADEASVPEDGNTTIPVLTNDTFGGDGPSTGTITITQGPSNGTASVDDNGTPTDPTDDQITYTPNADYNGADNIIYEICDSNGDCDTAIVNITVTPVNDLPTAEADEASVPEDGNTTIPVLTNDTFGGDGPSTGTITITQGPSNGTASVDDNGTPTDPTDDQITYTPNADYNGADNIIYEICDSNGDCDTAIVNITVTPVNDLPTAEADEASVPEDGNTTIPVLTNDTFGGDGPSTGTITITQGPSNGTASVDDNGTPTDPTDDQITYTPNADYNGADNIIYEICDSNGDCDTAIVNITVTPVNDLPTAEADEASVPEDGNTTIPVLTNDTFGGDGPSTGTITITQGPSNGTASVDDNGTPTDPTDDQITYTPNADYNGADNIIYEICDSNGDCDTAIVNITVTPVNDLPTAEADEASVPEDGNTTIPVLTNDTFGGDGPSTGTITITQGPSNGTASVDDNGTPTDPTDDQITYTPNADYNGADNIIYEICDSNGDCDTAIVNITVTPVNDLPTAEADEASVPEDGNTTIPVLTNDTFGGDGPSTGTITITQGPSNGTASVDDNGTPTDPTDDQITYTPNADYNGADNIIYEICDSNGDCDTAIVNITVTPVNDPPVVPDTVVTTPEDTPIVVCLPISDVDTGEVHTSVLGCNPVNGTVTSGPSVSNGEVCITYTPNTNYNGTDSLCVVVCDAGGLCDTGYIVINIPPVNDPPVVPDTVVTTPEDTPIVVCLPISDVDTGEVHTSVLGCNPVNGTVTSGPSVSNGEVCITYTPNTNYNGTDSLCVVVCDAGGLCDTGYIVINIPPVNDPPVVPDTVVTTPEDTPIVVCLPISDVDTGEVHTAVLGCNPVNGTVTSGPSVSNGEVCITYTPDKNYNGKDSLCVVVCDAGGLCDTGYIVINIPPVNDPPVVPDTVVTTPEDTPIVVCLPISDVDTGEVHTAVLGCNPVNGTVTSGPSVSNGEVCITYTPDKNYNGKDSLCVVVCDAGGLCDTGYIVINIPPVNDPPVVPDTVVTTPEDTPIVVCLPISDVDTGEVHTAVLGCNPVNGTVTSGPSVSNGEVCITYTPDKNYNGKDSLCVVVCDAGGLCDTGVIYINIPPTTDTLTPTTPIEVIDTICNITIPEGDNVVITGCDGSITGTTPLGGTWSIDPQTGCLVYTAGPIKGNDTICITACDTLRGFCNTTTVVVTVTGHAPTAVTDSTSTPPNEPVIIPVLSNDTTHDEDPLILCSTDAIVTQPIHGTVVVNQDGTITYTPSGVYNGWDSLQYQICDPEGNDTAWVYILVEDCIFPNAFSPNGDGINDVLEIPCLEGDVYFSVWNRWGIEVYRNDKYINDWDGTYKGNPLPEGTYYYILEYTRNTGEVVNKANFVYLRR